MKLSLTQPNAFRKLLIPIGIDFIYLPFSISPLIQHLRLLFVLLKLNLKLLLYEYVLHFFFFLFAFINLLWYPSRCSHCTMRNVNIKFQIFFFISSWDMKYNAAAKAYAEVFTGEDIAEPVFVRFVCLHHSFVCYTVWFSTLSIVYFLFCKLYENCIKLFDTEDSLIVLNRLTICQKAHWYYVV